MPNNLTVRHNLQQCGNCVYHFHFQKLCIPLPLQNVFLCFCMIRKLNSDYFVKQHSQTGVCNVETVRASVAQERCYYI